MNNDLRCKECNRFLNLKPHGTIVMEVRCPNSSCKQWNKIKITNSNSSVEDLNYTFQKDTLV